MIVIDCSLSPSFGASSPFGALGRQCFMIVAFAGYLHLYFIWSSELGLTVHVNCFLSY